MKKKGCLVPFIIFLIVIFALLVIIFNQAMKDVEKHPEKYDDSIAAKYIDVSLAQSKKIDDVLKKCGIEDITSFEHDELLDNAHKKGETGYRLANDRADNIILYLNKDKSVYRISYAGYKLYSKNKVKARLQDYTFSFSEINKWQINCEEKVKEVLKSPSTAKFPNYTEWGFSKNKTKIIIQGYVDSQNSFGAEIRSEFQFKINAKSNKITSFIFDGEELIK